MISFLLLSCSLSTSLPLVCWHQQKIGSDGRRGAIAGKGQVTVKGKGMKEQLVKKKQMREAGHGGREK
jgi:hypothetical protein